MDHCIQYGSTQGFLHLQVGQPYPLAVGKISACQLVRKISRDLASRLRQTANVRLKFPVYQKLVKFIWFQLIFCLLASAMEQIL